MNFIPGELRPEGAGPPSFVSAEGQIAIELSRPRGDFERPTRPSPPSRASRATLGIRCEHVHEDPDGSIAGQVLTEEYLGSASNVHVASELGRLVMRTDATTTRARGARVRLRLDPDQISVFDASTEQRL